MTKGDVDPATGLMLGEITPIENAGQVNAYMTLNIRGKRSKTDPGRQWPVRQCPTPSGNWRGRRTRISPEPEISSGPLHGIPIAVKRQLRHHRYLFAHDGGRHRPNMPTTNRRRMPPWLAKLRTAAGAIILGKTNLDEYAPAGIGRSTLGGQTCNPYDTKRITGGSSAGSAAAVAANLAICGLGTDTSGSIRYPSSLNALVRNGRDAGGW